MATTARPRRLGLRLLMIQTAIVLLTVLAVALVVLRLEDARSRDLAYDRVSTVARQIAADPDVRRWVNSPDGPARLQPLASLAEGVAGVAFVVVADDDGLRVTHPDPSRVGAPVSSGHEDVRRGESFRGVEDGPLGVTLRAKVPVWDDDRVIGSVSVGVPQAQVRADLLDVVLSFAPWILAAAALGTLGAAWASRYVRRRIYGVDPEHMPALLRSQEALLHSVGDGVVGVDGDGTVILVNDEARRLLGVPADAAGKIAAEAVPGEAGVLLTRPHDAAETSLLLADERILLARLRSAEVGGREPGWTLTVQDRTELQQSLRELEGQRGLAETLRAQTHEFANRLHVLSGLLSLDEVEEARRYLDTLTSRPDTATVRQGVDDPAVSALLSAKATWAREAGVRLVVDEDSRTPKTAADEDLLTVLSNLVTNAVEAAGDGGEVRVLLQSGADDVLVRVDDSGPGLAGRSVEELTGWGVSSKRNRDEPVGGRGVGLALVSRIIARRGGQLQAGDSPLGGSRFVARWTAGPRCATVE